MHGTNAAYSMAVFAATVGFTSASGWTRASGASTKVQTSPTATGDVPDAGLTTTRMITSPRLHQMRLAGAQKERNQGPSSTEATANHARGVRLWLN